MFKDYGPEIANLKRMMANAITVAHVSEVDKEKGRVKVSIDGENTDYLPVLTSRSTGGDRSSWLPEVDEQVLMIAIGGNINNGYVLGSISTHANSTKKTSDYKIYSDGTVIEYDKESHSYLVDVKESGKITFNVVGGSASVTAKDVVVTASENADIKAKNASVKASEGVGVDAKTVDVKGTAIKFEGPASFTETVTVAQSVTCASVATGGIASKPGGSLTVGNVAGSIKVESDVVAGGVSLKTHSHPYIKPAHPDGPADTDPPTGGG